jgi:hypothetical protein
MVTVQKLRLYLAHALWLGGTLGEISLGSAAAQTPPTAAEIATYHGLYTAVARADRLAGSLGPMFAPSPMNVT